MMQRISIPLIIAVLAAIAAAPAHASMLLIDQQSAPPSRVAVYVEDATIDVSDTINTPTRTRQIDLTMIYEATDKPLWAEYQLQFKCPNRYYSKNLARPAKTAKSWVLPDQDTVEFRSAGGASSTKQSPDIANLAPTDWQTTSSYTMKRAWRVACDGDSIEAAERASATARVIDSAALRPKLAELGLSGAELVPDGLNMSRLADFTWDNLWKDVPKPKINHGRKLTPAEEVAFRAQLAQFRQQIDAAQAELTGRATAMKVGLDFTETAAKYRGRRRLSPSEAILVQVWLGKSEEEVVAANGTPSMSQAGPARLLSYGQAFDNTVLWQNVATGATFTGGGYKSCNVRYALIPDSAGIPRVADVNIFATIDGDARGLANPCTDIMNAPNP